MIMFAMDNSNCKAMEFFFILMFSWLIVFLATRKIDDKEESERKYWELKRRHEINKKIYKEERERIKKAFKDIMKL